MANRFLGEATVTVEGKVYTLRLDFNAMCAFEEATGRDAMEVLSGFETGKFKASDIRALAHAMLQRHHPDASQELAGDILSADLGALQRAVLAAQPVATEGAAGNGDRRAKVRPA